MNEDVFIVPMKTSLSSNQARMVMAQRALPR